jgi:hypothetical protein
MTGRLRRREVPTRTLGERLVVARPADGAPVVLAETATSVWADLAEWTTTDRLLARLAATFPEVPDRHRRRALEDILGALETDDLLARA